MSTDPNAAPAFAQPELTVNSSTEEITRYLQRALAAGIFGIPAKAVPKLQDLVSELARRSMVKP